mmetsp:Transcript_2787/g.4482  ORF Transcript_2787/g.4482 Transcript_2787/m.4482 type:complete len:133 (-) Transcript_2787:35-433(-)
MNDIVGKPWFSAMASRADAERRLTGTFVGNFLVRKSSQPGQLALSVYNGTSVSHTVIYQENGVWCTEIGRDGAIQRAPSVEQLLRSVSGTYLVFPDDYESSSVLQPSNEPAPPNSYQQLTLRDVYMKGDLQL